jgi:hypothetical protein
MTRIDEIRRWIDEAEKNQPKETLAIFVHITDGLIHIGLGDSPIRLSMKDFFYDDLLPLKEDLLEMLQQAYDNAPAEITDD